MSGQVGSISATTVHLLDATDALDAWGYVNYGDAHPDLGTMKCRTKSVALAPGSTGNLWILTSTYIPNDAPKPGSGSGPGSIQDPPPEPPSSDTWSRNVDVQAVPYTAEAEKDYNGVEIKNSAGVWFNPGITRTTYDTLSYSFTWCQFAFPTSILSKCGKVQDTDVTVTFCENDFAFETGKALLKDCKISSVRQDGKNFWTVTAVVETQPTAYDPISVPDVGMTDVHGKPYLTDSGFPVQMPVRLYYGEPSEDGSGTVDFTMHGTANFVGDIPED